MLRLAILAIAPMLTATGCLLPPDNDILQFEDDFEACDLCGWATTGDVRRVSTYHPAEHAMALAPGARAATPLAITRNAAESGWESDDGNWVELSTDCVGPGALDLVPDGAGGLVVAVTLDDRARAPFARHWLNFPPLDPEVAHRFTALTLTTATLRCQVDNLQIRISGGLYAY